VGKKNNCWGEQTSFFGGTRYVGEFRNDKPQGLGALHFRNGDRYVGEIRDGEPGGMGGLSAGPGVLYSGDGRIKEAGTWQGGRLVSRWAVSPTLYPFDLDLNFKHSAATSALGEVSRQDDLVRIKESEDAEAENLRRIERDQAQAHAQLSLRPDQAAGAGSTPPQEQAAYQIRQEDLARLAREQQEAQRRQADDLERERIAAETQERERLAAESRQRVEQAERDRLIAQVEAERKKRQELEERLAAEVKERERLAAATAAAQRPTPVAAPAQQGRIALIIGNAAYKDSPLANPVNDATDIAAALQRVGFEVILRTNVSRPQMRAAVREFGESLRRKEVGLFYFAGHGIESRGKNFLIPVGANVASEFELEDEALDTNSVLRAMEEAGNSTNVMILDACRDNPFARSWRSASRGLAQMSAPTGSFIAFATAPGSVAADGTGRNGTFTKHLLASLQQPDLDIDRVFTRVTAAVAQETGRKQVPWKSSSLTGAFSF
jgi:hypothetical protein